MPDAFYSAAERELKEAFPRFKNMSPAHLLTAIFVKYILNKGELSLSDFDLCFMDRPSDGGIDAIWVFDDDADNPRIALIQSKYVQQINKDDVVAAVEKISRTLANLSTARGKPYHLKLRQRYEQLKSQYDQADISIIICTTASPSPKLRDSIHTGLQDMIEFPYEVSVYYGNEIEEAIEEIDEPKQEVEEDVFEFSRDDQWIEFGKDSDGNPRGLVLNVSASSLHKMYARHHNRGLFAQNLRTFIRNKKVDDAISHTINKNPDDFWFKNNGLTIACEDFLISGNRLKLYNFSVINGCQTMTRIGHENINREFYVCCKVIREANRERMAELAEAANRQKPIQPRDLKSNDRLQQRMKREFESSFPPVYLTIKRGTKRFTPRQLVQKNLRGWQQLENTDYGQLVLAFHLQKPNIAFAHKGNIFSVSETYSEVFHRRRDYLTEIDLIRLHDAYNQWRDSALDKSHDDLYRAISNYGRFAIIANCAIIIKLKRGLFKIENYTDPDLKTVELSRSEIAGRLFDSNSIDLSQPTEEKLVQVFDWILDLHQGVLEDHPNVAQMYKRYDFYRDVVVGRLLQRYRRPQFFRYLQEGLDAFI